MPRWPPMADLIHLQVVAPVSMRAAVTDYVEGLPAACNVVVLAGAARQPHGDVLTFDLPREAINEVIDRLEALGVAEHGSITLFHTELTLSRHAERAHEHAPGDPDHTVIWDRVAENLRTSAVPTFAYLSFFVIAAVIAAAGILTDSPILIVGAMVVGPEYAPLASISYGLFHRDGGLIVRGASTLLLGTLLAVGCCRSSDADRPRCRPGTRCVPRRRSADDGIHHRAGRLHRHRRRGGGGGRDAGADPATIGNPGRASSSPSPPSPPSPRSASSWRWATPPVCEAPPPSSLSTWPASSWSGSPRSRCSVGCRLG